MMGFIGADLRRHWAGSLVIVLLVALSVGLGVAVTLQERALRLGSARAADKFDIVVGAPGSDTQLVLSTVFLQPSPLPLVDGHVLHDLTQDQGVAMAAPVGFGDSYRDYPIVGTTTALVSVLAPQLAEGRSFATLGEAVIGSSVALSGSTVTPIHGAAGLPGEAHAEVEYTIVGRMPETGTVWDRAILVPIASVWAVHGMGEHNHDHDEHSHNEASHEDGHDHAGFDPAAPINESFSSYSAGVPAIVVRPTSIADAYRLRQSYRNGETQAVFPAEVLTRLYATLGDARTVLLAVTGVTQGIVAAALVLVAVLHIGQRRRQIGALRAFGAPAHAVFALIWGQLSILVLAGIALGLLLGWQGAQLMSSVFAAQNGMRLPIESHREDFRYVLLLVTFAGVIAAVPSVLVYRQSPAEALRS
ncbi:FtsX-like permease family protein [Aureimonas fodinaquatilis]|uniref:FtsX-like permease family protein n=1 Tax=Aureimonas fodinaquatilis TaxID=2565783 RepID=A0A5B0DR59_9HYPH|nr:FtsX-like permease family protein [Aureimonas fodinaquatilis]KAA0968482.1 FtsX-like permease family protein [Aureimonas fodinaquatilis]